MARTSSTPLFVVGVAAALVARAAILAAVIGFTRRRFAFALRFYLAALVPALLASGLDFSGRAILYAYLIWAGLLIVLVTFIVLGAAPWVGRDVLRRAIADARGYSFRFGAVATYLFALTIIGAVWRHPGDASQVLVVPLSGALTAVTARRLSEEPSRRLSFRSFALIATGVVVGIVALTIGMTRGGTERSATAPSHKGSLVLIGGVDTSTGNGALFRLDPRTLGFSCRQTFYYSYAGLGRGAPQGEAWCPIQTGAPYDKADTTLPLQQLVFRLRNQIALLPRPVVIVTHSQGAWIAWSEITADGEQSPVRALVMLAPFSEGLAPYPPPGKNGTGAAGGAAARIVTDIGRRLGINEFDPDSPLARELQATSGAVERLVARPLPRRVRGLAVLARADLPLEPHPWPHDLPETCPGWLTHAAVPTSSRVATAVDRFLAGFDVAACPGWITGFGHASDAFGAPSPAASEE